MTRFFHLDIISFFILKIISLYLIALFISKTDESSEAASLGFLLPAHEYFHEMMVIADCEAELVRDPSRGLEGGAFFVATLLNRKEAKTGQGKHSIDAMKDFMLLKSDARFCQYFIKKFDLNPEVDNTPDHLKSASYDRKEAFIHNMVEDALRDLLPFFSNCTTVDPELLDHPLQDGKRAKYEAAKEKLREVEVMEQGEMISQAVAENTIEQIRSYTPEPGLAEQYIEQVSVALSGSRSKLIFNCKLCSFQSRFKSVCVAHIQGCLLTSSTQQAVSEPVDSSPSISCEHTDVASQGVSCAEVDEADADDDDMFWNYKNAEFFLDAMFAICTSFERFGDGLGFYITNKIFLPIFHGLRHSNYSNTIHRFITRILCEATPKEGLKMIHERFSNRVGQPGHNISRDRRMEYRIGTAKKLISNLGPNFNSTSVQQVNSTLDIKEELFLKTRESHGVDIRSGKHNARSDTRDYEMLFSHLSDIRAHVKVSGRKFGNINFGKDIMEDDRFDKTEFYRWIVAKNKEAKSVLAAKQRQ